ncbi:hypothetical protein LY78DRAFT_686607 [Colletotrichum sublineola]|nr:hypothetical protein LY78DRAFT_686607 [Colletotrichum sublineola]
MIFNYCLNIRAYFVLFRDIALLYGDVNVQFISPGLGLVNRMQTEYNANGSDDVKNKILEEKTRKVSEYTKSSVAGVKLLVGKVCPLRPSHYASVSFLVEPSWQLGCSIGHRRVKQVPHTYRVINCLFGGYRTEQL